MRLLASTDIALRTLMRLAHSPGNHINSDELARELAVSRNHLQKVVQTLTDGGFVETLRGPKGGVRLARPTTGIHVGEVVRWFEREQAVVDCFQPDGGTCTLRFGCRLKARLNEAGEVFLAHLDGTTLDELVSGP